MIEPNAPQEAEPVSLRYRTLAILAAIGVAVGIALLPTTSGLTPAGQRLGAVAAAMAILWSTQALPLAVTSLLPLIAFPALAIQTSDVVSKAYMNSTILLYLSGFGIAIGVERWGLHRRLALLCLLALGTSPRRIVLGFMLGTALMSMWISNTAATLLMLPIALAVLASLTGEALAQADSPAAQQNVQRFEKRMTLALLLGIAYAASIGGMSTLIGTPTNGVYVGYWTSAGVSPELAAQYSVSSGQWVVMFFPMSACLFLVTWLVVCLPLKNTGKLGHGAYEEILARYRELGSMKSGELRMQIVFSTVAILWLTRASIEFGSFTLPGWESGLDALFATAGSPFRYAGWLTDSTVGLFMMSLMFIIPAKDPATGKTVFLMDWETIEAKTPWGILLLFGGGFALAGACSSSGLSAWLGDQIAQHIGSYNELGRIAGVTALVTFLTEFTSNTATVSTLLPILHETATALKLDPRVLMLPATVAASCAFMLPIATPPNAIVFSSNRLKVSQMIFVGFWLNLLAIAIITLFTWGWVLRMEHVPLG